MYFPVLFGLPGIYDYITIEQPDEYDVENLYITGGMFYLSSIFWLPYLIIIFFRWKKFPKKLIIITSIPFAFMLIMTIYITHAGIPW